MDLKYMKRIVAMLGMALAVQSVSAAEQQVIRISTEKTDLVLQVAPNGRLYQTYLGAKVLHADELKKLLR